MMTAALLPVAAVAQGTAAGIDVAQAMAPRMIGKADAKVTLVEYFSMTCSHCAHFHTETLPKIKQKYIDAGLVKLELRDFPLDPWALRAAAMARAAPAERYEALVGVLMQQQPRWTQSSDIAGALERIGRLAGLSPELIRASMADGPLLDAILQGRLDGQRNHNINSTPSFVLEGKTLSGALGFDEFDKLLAKAAG
jgi:protein-disulfide isomerase